MPRLKFLVLVYFVIFSGVILQLTDDDYLANERDLSIGVDVTKNFRIATDLVLTVSPITLTEARELSLLPRGVEVPDDNMGRSPVEAGIHIYHLYYL